MDIIASTDDLANRSACDAILSQLPDWFGPRDIYVDYLDDLADRLVFLVQSGPDIVGLMALTQTSDACIDIHVMAVLPAFHRHGIGQALVDEARCFARAQKARLLTVKTLGPSRPNAAYAQTHAFYQRQGFFPIEEFIDFWGECYPMLLLGQTVDPA